MMGCLADTIVLSEQERGFLKHRCGGTRRRGRFRIACKMVLLCAEGLQSKDVAARLGGHEHPVGKWRRRFVRKRIEGLTDE